MLSVSFSLALIGAVCILLVFAAFQRARHTLFVIRFARDIRPSIIHVHIRKNIYFLIELKMRGLSFDDEEKRALAKQNEIRRMARTALEEIDALLRLPEYASKTFYMHSWLLQDNAYFTRKMEEKGFRKSAKSPLDAVLIRLSYPFLVRYMTKIGHGDQVATPQARQAHLQLWVRRPAAQTAGARAPQGGGRYYSPDGDARAPKSIHSENIVP